MTHHFAEVVAIKKASVSMSDYSGRPTFSDLVGPVRLYRKGGFTGKIVLIVLPFVGKMSIGFNATCRKFNAKTG